MKTYNFIIILFILSCTGLNIFSNVPSKIYYGKKGSWYIYVDLQKEIKVVEIGGIKYGFLDVLDNIGRKDTIASSGVGILLYEEEGYEYVNKELKLNIKLKEYDYTKQIDAKRYKLYSIDAFMKISKLKKKFNNKGYVIENNEIYQDYLYFRDNIKFNEDYIPSYLIRFYTEIE